MAKQSKRSNPQQTMSAMAPPQQTTTHHSNKTMWVIALVIVVGAMAAFMMSPAGKKMISSATGTPMAVTAAATQGVIGGTGAAGSAGMTWLWVLLGLAVVVGIIVFVMRSERASGVRDTMEPYTAAAFIRAQKARAQIAEYGRAAQEGARSQYGKLKEKAGKFGKKPTTRDADPVELN